MAYVTVSGVRSLLSAFPNGEPEKSRWLVGIDDAVSQPGAIRLLQTLPNARVRWASLSNLGKRFHPKAILIKARRAADTTLMIGSANLTAAALTRNAEAVSLLRAETDAEAATLQAVLDELWQLGTKPTEKRIEEYEERYRRAAKLRKDLAKVTENAPRATSEILTSDTADIDPSLANVCWIECGSITAMGRELELKAEQGLFFGLSRSGGAPAIFNFLVSDDSIVPLRMKYQGNHMWRLQLNAQVPEVAAGLRPVLTGGGLGRSPFVAVIERTGAQPPFKLSFIKDNSREFSRLIRRSKATGTFGRTSSRQFGWCA